MEAFTLEKADISFESHIYAYGPHGFTIGNSSVLTPGKPICNRAYRWVEDSIDWLKDMFGDFSDCQMTEPVCKTCFSDDNAEFLSTECTIGHLMKFPEAKKVIGDFADSLDEAPEMLEAVRNMLLKGLFRFIKVPQETIDEINEKLNSIPNIVD